MSDQVQADERLGLLSASFMPIAANCPGAKQLCDALKREGKLVNETSVVQEGGIDIHSALETDDFEGLKMDDREIAFRLKNQENIAKDNWMQKYWDGKAELEVLREQRVWIRDLKTFKLLCSAKVDVTFLYRLARSGLVIDFKTGYLTQTPSELNWQLKTQAVAVWHEYPELEHIRVGIAASRLRDKLDLSDYSLAALRDAQWEVLHVIVKTKEPGAPRYAGDWCRYCPAKASCREYASWNMMEVVPFDGKDDLDLVLAVQQLAPAAIARIHLKAKSIKVLMEAVKGRLSNMTDDQLAEIGLKRKKGANRRNVKKPDKLRDILLEHISMADLISRVTPGFGEIDDIIMTKFGIQKKDVKAKVAELFGDAIEETTNAPSIEQL